MRKGVFAHWPNRITALRFLGALALFAILDRCERMPGARAADPVLLQWAFWLFIAVALSDILDGWLARRGNVITAFGRIADPFVDKVLVLGAMIFLAVLDWSRAYFPAWVVVVVLAREFLITGIRGYAESLGQKFPADWFGKVKMLVQCWAVGIVIGLEAFELSPQAEARWQVAGHACVIATLVTSLGSGLSYVVKARRLFSGSAP
jgi:CDP-diacylglycerol--glycerol-3-phosphate 3-phosphatidyltransferase